MFSPAHRVWVFCINNVCSHLLPFTYLAPVPLFFLFLSRISVRHMRLFLDGRPICIHAVAFIICSDGTFFSCYHVGPWELSDSKMPIFLPRRRVRMRCDDIEKRFCNTPSSQALHHMILRDSLWVTRPLQAFPLNRSIS